MNSLGLFFEKSCRISRRARHRQPARSALRSRLLAAAGDFLRAALSLMRLVGSAARLRRLAHDVLLRRGLLGLLSGGTFCCHFDNLLCRIGRLRNQGCFAPAPQKSEADQFRIRRSFLVPRRRVVTCVGLRRQLDQLIGLTSQARGGLIVGSKKRVKRKSFADKRFGTFD